tara:strand:- start:221 stop:1969 length:1749 start_codon:yes stop_codon:yes gene_type:complete
MFKKQKIKLSKESYIKASKIFKFLKPQKSLFIIGFVFLLLSSLSSLIIPKYLGEMVDSSSENINEITLILFILLAAQAIFSYFRIVIFVRVTEKTLALLRQTTYNHMITLPMNFFSKERVGELNSRIAADISLLQEAFTTDIAELIRQIIILIGGIILLCFISLELTLFMLALIPVFTILAIFFGRLISRLSKKVQKEIAESNTIVEETFQAISIVKAFTNEMFEINRYKEKTNKAAITAIKSGKFRGLFASFIIFGLFGAIISVLWYGVQLIQAGNIEEGQLFTFVIYSAFIGASIGGMAEIYARLQKAIGGTEKLMEILDVTNEQIYAEQNLIRLNGKVEFKNVTFSYSNRPENKVISSINLTANPGEKIAIVGPSGSGKTTLTSLLLQFYIPESGEILFDQKNYKNFSIYDIRNSISIVPQDIILFGGTILENIAYGKHGSTKKEIINAAKSAYAHEFISQFPEKYNTIVGERGTQLSGGQRQRIAIARAVLKDPSILILDEATSSLDSESERIVQLALEKLMKGRTSFIIAHRLSTIKSADNIIVLESGKIIEEGNHDFLISNKDGMYYSLNKLQSIN